jgi:hypothetical protein
LTPNGHPRAIAAIVGAGRTKFGELWYQNPEKLLFEAGLRCIKSVDNGLSRRDLQACFFGSFLYQTTNKLGARADLPRLSGLI